MFHVEQLLFLRPKPKMFHVEHFGSSYLTVQPTQGWENLVRQHLCCTLVPVKQAKILTKLFSSLSSSGYAAPNTTKRTVRNLTRIDPSYSPTRRILASKTRSPLLLQPCAGRGSSCRSGVDDDRLRGHNARRPELIHRYFSL